MKSQFLSTPWHSFRFTPVRVKAFQLVVLVLPVGILLLCAATIASTAETIASTEKESLEPQAIKLWNGRAPIGEGKFEDSDATITVHQPRPRQSCSF